MLLRRKTYTIFFVETLGAPDITGAPELSPFSLYGYQGSSINDVMRF